MEEILLRRVEVRQARLVAVLTTAAIEYEAGHIENDRAALILRQLKELLKKLDEEVKHYSTTSNRPLVNIVNDALEKQMEAEDLITKFECAVDVFLSQNSLSRVAQTTRLPKLELPKFTGDQLKWSEFWDKFQVNVHERNLPDVDKLSYLLSCLEGTALEAVAGLATNSANYSIAVDTLRRRFGSSDLLIDAHYTALSGIPKAEYNSQSCRWTLDSIENHIRILEKLGEPVNGNHFRAMILGKFPDKVIHEYHLMNTDNSTVTIRESLHRIVRAMERSSLVTNSGIDLQPSVAVSKQAPGPSTSTTEALQVRVETKAKSFRKRKQPNNSSDVPAKMPRRPCIFCQLKNHTSAECRKFKSLEERKAKLGDRCYRCLGKNHKVKNCKRKIVCFQCKGDHLKLLCPRTSSSSGEYNKVDFVTHNDSVCNISNCHTFLQTAVARICKPDSNEYMSVRLLLDSGSQRSYITTKAAKILGFSTAKEDLLLIYTFGTSTPQEMSSPSSEIILETKRGISRKIQVNIVPHITDRIVVSSFDCDKIDINADDDTLGEGIDLLVGNDFYCSFIRDGKIKIDSNLYLLDTDFGWVLSGNITQGNTHNILSVTTYCQCHVPTCPYFTEPDLPLRNIDIKFLWSLECIGITDSPKTTRQEEAVAHFNETVRYHNGRYEIKWPWIQYPPDLPTNYGLALGRLKSLLKKMTKDTFNEYNNIIKKQMDLGIIEVVDENSINQNNNVIHYLPHHMVKQKGKRGRLVYDASAKISGQKSLNECLYSGPSMLEDLVALLLQFRTKCIGITADVEKAFLQVGIQNKDRDVTRFLWLKNLEQEPVPYNLIHLRFCRVPFGIISSPFLLTATIRHHIAQTNGNLMNTIADKCYVDNLVTGADSIIEAQHIFQSAMTSFHQLGMNIRDWVSNEKTFLETIPKQLKEIKTEEVKVLGLLWNVRKDSLKLNIVESHIHSEVSVTTKREVLRVLGRIYDPCGFVCPLILPMKILFQNICERKVKWDSPLPEDLVRSLKITLQQLKKVINIELPRYIGIESQTAVVAYELHCFTDASKNAYAAVVYLRAQIKEQTNVKLVMAKSHISRAEDKHELKIPKLELLGFLIGSRLLKYVNTNLELQIGKRYLWTDSLVVLGWMNSNKLLPPFVANRVNEIKRNHQQTEMCYINIKLNPADLATRAELWDQKEEIWFNGPRFLREDESSWPSNRHYDAHKTSFFVGEVPLGEMDIQGNVERDINNIPVDTIDAETVTQEHIVTNNTLDETAAEIKKLHKRYFADEVSDKKTHLGRTLDLFGDVDGLLRCRGRMANTSWNYDMKHPILLLKDCEFTNRIIQDTHEKNYHVGAAHTLSIITERYWIPQGKIQVQKVIRRCQQCVKHGGGPYKLPPTPALPPERVNYSQPFSFTGIDYFGPLYVTTESGKEKRWVALFTCLAVRALHLEIVKDLTAEETLLAFRRFISARGVPIRIYSDNATCFKLTSEVMTTPYCIEKDIQWKFIPQLAPWHGGFYERLVALVKHCLKRTLEKHLLNDSKLLTVMKEVEAVLNTRPLTHVGTEVIHTLRPADFLSMGKCLTVNPSSMEVPNFGTNAKIDLIKSWKKDFRLLKNLNGCL